MAKYGYKFKKRVVECYRRGEGGYITLAQMFGIASSTTVLKWVKQVEQFGFKALKRRKNKHVYSTQFKQDVLHYYLTSGESYRDVALKYNLPSMEIVVRWYKTYLEKGIEGLSPKPRRRLPMSKKNRETANRKKKR